MPDQKELKAVTAAIAAIAEEYGDGEGTTREFQELLRDYMERVPSVRELARMLNVIRPALNELGVELWSIATPKPRAQIFCPRKQARMVRKCTRITKAPYLSLLFVVDVANIRKLYDEVADSALDGVTPRAAVTARAAPGLVDALHRYLTLADSPADARVLAPLVSKEIHYRLLTAPFGAMLRSLLRHDSTASAITRAIAHLRADVRSPVAIPELARRVGMSASAFHKHFKTITSTTPLQYQKDLRLLEAQRLLKTGGTSVTTVAYDVGYESPSQFSREYARKFGVAPSRDVPGATV